MWNVTHVHKRKFKTNSSDLREACSHFCFFPLNIGFSIQGCPGKAEFQRKGVPQETR